MQSRNVLGHPGTHRPSLHHGLSVSFDSLDSGSHMLGCGSLRRGQTPWPRTGFRSHGRISLLSSDLQGQKGPADLQSWGGRGSMQFKQPCVYAQQGPLPASWKCARQAFQAKPLQQLWQFLLPHGQAWRVSGLRRVTACLCLLLSLPRRAARSCTSWWLRCSPSPSPWLPPGPLIQIA